MPAGADVATTSPQACSKCSADPLPAAMCLPRSCRRTARTGRTRGPQPAESLIIDEALKRTPEKQVGGRVAIENRLDAADPIPNVADVFRFCQRPAPASRTGPRPTYAFDTRSFSAMSGAIAVHSARSAAVVSCPGVGVAADGGEDGAADAVVCAGRVRLMMPTTSAAVASTIAAATAIAHALDRRVGRCG